MERCLEKNHDIVRKFAMFKEGGEIHFFNQLENSTWRTFDQSSADYIVVPIRFGLSATHRVCGKEGRGFMDNITMDERHILMSTDFKVGHDWWCPNCVHIKGHTGSSPQRSCKIVAPMNSQLHAEYLGRFNCSSSVEWEARRYSYYFGGQADGRKAYKDRRRVLASFERIKSKVTSGQVEQFVSGRHVKDSHYLERVVNTKVGLHIRGDTLNSNRLFEWIEVGSLVVILADGFYEQAAPGLHIPWKNFTIQVSGRSSDAELDSQLIRISNLPSWLVKRKLEMMKKFEKRILWTVPGSKVAETLLLDVADKCSGWPQWFYRNKVDRSVNHVGLHERSS